MKIYQISYKLKRKLRSLVQFIGSGQVYYKLQQDYNYFFAYKVMSSYNWGLNAQYNSKSKM